MYNHWTTKQEQFLAEHSGEEVSEIATAMEKEFGVKRSARSIACRASIRGISLARVATCANCGAHVKAKTLKANGWCALCTAKANRDNAKARAERVQANERVIEDELPKVEREYAMFRQRKHRAERKQISNV